ncbi:MAG: hypothetical protein ABI315_06650 [Bacteroidia bacterium]
MKKYIIVFIYICFSFILKAQEDGAYRKNMIQGNLLTLEENYTQALNYYLAAYKVDSTNSNINYKIGVTYIKTISGKLKALSYLQKSIAKTTQNYDPFNVNEKAAPITAFYYYGQALHLNYKFDEAIANYEKFKSLLGKKQIDVSKDVDRQIKISEYAKTLVAAPMNVVIKNLGSTINTPYPEYSPVISADENTLIFTSRRPGSTGGDKTADGQFYEDIYISYRGKDGLWSEPKSISPNINTVTNDASVGLTADAQTLLIYKDSNGGDIYESKLEGDTWSIPKPMGSNINTPSWETSACLTPDGNTLYFVSNRKGGIGGRDIWRCVKLPNGKWSLAVNLGKPINTEFDEEAPFIHPNGNLLFFSSNGHNTIGGFDIFFANMIEKNVWEEPLNIGYPINTTDDDIFYVTSPDGKRGYYSSDSRPDGFGEKDIYQVSIPEYKEQPLVLIKGQIITGDEKKLPKNLEIVVINNKNDSIIGTYTPLARDGSFIIIIPPGNDYKLSYTNDGKEFHSEIMNVPESASYQEIDKAIVLKEINVDSLLLENKNINTTTNNHVPSSLKDTLTSSADNNFSDKNSLVYSKTPHEELAKTNKLYFEMYFKYNVTETDINGAPFKQFIANLVATYKAKGVIHISIVSSASHVPTRTFKTNKVLSIERNKKMQKQLINALKDKGIPENKVKIKNIQTIVDGPVYKNDYIINKDIYEKYQYIKVGAKK